MKILRESDKAYIAKRLAAIYYIAVHWKTDDVEFLEKVLSNISDIAYRIGGIEMIEKSIPFLVANLEMRKGLECACDHPCEVFKEGE